ncbi:MAG: glycosyltransferase, partial [Thermus sp.]|uniref:glycosyltransferase n=1 Tax=Thermus sp. TaxID=275 RepID=UPI00391B2F24
MAIFLPSLAGGGAEKVNLLLAQGLSARGIQVDLVLASAHGPYLENVPPGVGVFDLNTARTLMALRPLVSYLRRRKPTILLSSLSHANVVAVWAKHSARVNTRAVVAEHSV